MRVIGVSESRRSAGLPRTFCRLAAYSRLSMPGWGKSSWTAAPTGLDDEIRERHGRYAMNMNVDQFLQECPVCGRPLQVSSELTGRRVTCLHCRGRFLASSSAADSLSPTSGASLLLRRAEKLIEMASRKVELCAATAASHSVHGSATASPWLQGDDRPSGRAVGTLWRDLQGFARYGPY